MSDLADSIRYVCPKCGYDLRGIEPDGYRVGCPECGGGWFPAQLGDCAETLHQRIRSVYLRWGLGGGIVVAAMVTASVGWALATLIAHRWSTGPMFSVVASGSCVVVVLLLWGAALRCTGRSFTRVFDSCGLGDPERRTMRATGVVFLMHIALIVVACIGVWMVLR